ncbi:hypothetical protein MPSEU_000753500 [Mayamaea pseudoterrestris]|nr:hypothetical protein MPSEU_000753500 [Mayamaea pseudoterrestris]
MSSDYTVYWQRHMSHDDFISLLERCFIEARTIRLCIDEELLEAYTQLTKLQASQVLKAFRKTVIHVVNFTSPPPNVSHFYELCETLGSIASIKHVIISYLAAEYNENVDQEYLCIVARCMRHCKKFEFCYYAGRKWDTGGEARVAELFHYLSIHPKLKTVKLCLEGIRVASALKCLVRRLHNSRMEELVLEAHDEEYLVDPDVASVLLTLLNRRINLQLSGFSFESQEGWQIFCAGIASSTVKKLSLSSFEIHSDMFASSLIQSGLPDLAIRSWQFDFAEHLPTFYINMSRSLPLMSLESLDLGSLIDEDGHEIFHMVNEDAMDNLVPGLFRAAVDCPSLVTFNLPPAIYTAAMDEALARWVRMKDSKLQNVTVNRIAPAFYHPPTCSPLLLTALTETCAVKNITWNTIDADYIEDWANTHFRGVVEGYGDDDSLSEENDGDLKSIETVLSLNHAGRGYMVVGAANRVACLKVLEKVKHNLDCLFFHLRENPTLCVSSNVVPTKKPIKKRSHWISEKDRPRKRQKTR